MRNAQLALNELVAVFVPGTQQHEKCGDSHCWGRTPCANVQDIKSVNATCMPCKTPCVGTKFKTPSAAWWLRLGNSRSWELVQHTTRNTTEIPGGGEEGEGKRRRGCSYILDEHLMCLVTIKYNNKIQIQLQSPVLCELSRLENTITVH